MQSAPGGRVYWESSVAPSPNGTTRNTPSAVSGQNSVAACPDSVQISVLTCRSQSRVGSVPASKYSVYTAFPLGSFVHTPGIASLPDLRQICTFTMPSGTGNPDRQSLMDALHDFLPYILVIGASSADRLACVVPTPDTCCVIGGKACKPQILTGRRSPAFSRRRHAGHPGPPAGWTHLDRCKLCSAGYGFPQGVGQQKSRLRFQGLMAFRYVLNQNLAVMIHNFRKRRVLYTLPPPRWRHRRRSAPD